MSFIATMDPTAVVLSVIPALFAAYFLFMFRQDKDKRKLMGGVSFAFLSLSSVAVILPLSSKLYFITNFYHLGDLPLIISLLIVFLSQIFAKKTFEKLFNVFLALFVSISLTIFIPANLYIFGVIADNILGFSALGLSLYLLNKNRKLLDSLFLLSILTFFAYSYSYGSSLGIAFSLSNYIASFIFIGLAFGFAPKENNWDSASIFKVNRQLDETKERLEELELEYRTIFESVNDAIFVIDSQTCITLDCNVEATKLLGLEKRNIVGKDQKTLFPFQKKEGLSSFVHRIDASKLVEFQVNTLKGEIKDVGAKFGTFQHDGNEIVVGVFRDVTEEKKNARDLSFTLEYLSNQMDKVQTLNEKLKVVGSLTRHDVRNKLTIANNNAYLLKKRLGDNPELNKYLDGIQLAVEQSNEFFEFSDLYERIGVEALAQISVADAFNQAASMFGNHEVKIVNNCEGLTVTADTMLSQLFYNLIDNSFKHAGSITKISLHFTQDQDKTDLFYEDDGIGVPQEYKRKIFCDGFTTGGSGLGLKLVKKMLESYGWTIEENGIPNVGARFQINIANKPPTRNVQQISFLPNIESNVKTCEQTHNQ
jgi:PAS domain S-box-containing protein